MLLTANPIQPKKNLRVDLHPGSGCVEFAHSQPLWETHWLGKRIPARHEDPALVSSIGLFLWSNWRWRTPRLPC